MNKIVEILMKRNGMTKAEAELVFTQTKQAVENAVASGNYDKVEDIMYSELGLEMDYILDILG